MHGRSRVTIDPRTPTMPGRSTSGFHRPGRHCLHQARSVVRCRASRMKGELHPTMNRYRSGFPCIWMTASTNRLILWCGHFQRQPWAYYVAASWAPYHITLRDTYPPSAELRFPAHKSDLTRPPTVMKAKKKQKTKKNGTLVCRSSRSERRVSQRRR